MCTYYFRNSMFFRITHPENATEFIDNMRLGECVMIIAAKRHNIKLGINNAPYPHFGNLNPTHYDDFSRRIEEECQKRKLTPPNLTVPGTVFDLSWIDESPETLRFVKAAFNKPEIIISRLEPTSLTEKNIKYWAPTPPILSDFPEVTQFKKCKRQFIKLEGMQSNLELIAANFLSLTLSPRHISRIIKLTRTALHLKNDVDPVVSALGISTPMSAVIAWAEKKGIDPRVITHLEQTIKVNKRLLSNAVKRYCINTLENETKGTFRDPIEIAKKIRTHYQNGKKVTDGRSIKDHPPITIVLSKEIYEKLENHKKDKNIAYTELMESLLIKHFEKIYPKKYANKEKSATINNPQDSKTLSAMAPANPPELGWQSMIVQAMKAND